MLCSSFRVVSLLGLKLSLLAAMWMPLHHSHTTLTARFVVYLMSDVPKNDGGSGNI